MALVEVARTGLVNMAVVTGVVGVPIGAITDMSFLNPDTMIFQPTPITVAVGKVTAVGVTGKNTNTVTQRMQFVVEVTDPSGTKTTHTGGLVTAPAGGFTTFQTGAITLDKQGTWKAEGILKAEIA